MQELGPHLLNRTPSGVELGQLYFSKGPQRDVSGTGTGKYFYLHFMSLWLPRIVYTMSILYKRVV